MSTAEQWVVDLDGVIWLGPEPIPGSGAAIMQLKAAGRQVAFFTNNSFTRHADILKKLADCGIACSPEDLLSSAQAAASLCKKGERALYVGGWGIAEALAAAGVEALAPDEAKDVAVDAVVVGFDPHFSFERMNVAFRAVNAGARLIGTNDDATFPMADGPVPGGGSILQAVAYACGVKPLVAGKPNDAAIALIADRIGKVDIAAGDRPSTDGALAERLHAKFALVHTGVKEDASAAPNVKVALEAHDFATLVNNHLAS